MTISKKLCLGFGVALFISLVMGLVSMYNLSTLGDKTTHLATNKARNLYLSGDINNLSSDILGSARGMNLRAHMNEPEYVVKLHGVAMTELDRIKKEAEEFHATTPSPEIASKLESGVLDKLPALSQGISGDYDLLQKGDIVAADAFFRAKVAPLSQEISEYGR